MYFHEKGRCLGVECMESIDGAYRRSTNKDMSLPSWYGMCHYRTYKGDCRGMTKWEQILGPSGPQSPLILTDVEVQAGQFKCHSANNHGLVINEFVMVRREYLYAEGCTSKPKKWCANIKILIRGPYFAKGTGIWCGPRFQNAKIYKWLWSSPAQNC